MNMSFYATGSVQHDAETDSGKKERTSIYILKLNSSQPCSICLNNVSTSKLNFKTLHSVYGICVI